MLSRKTRGNFGLVNDVSFILHCVASTSFKNEAIAVLTNVQGVKNILDLAEAVKVRDLRHVSTAYIAGDAREFSENELYVQQSLPNKYASSKLTGETMVGAWGARDGRVYTVFRPSILVGCEDGTTRHFHAGHGYMQPYYNIAESMRSLFETGKPLPKEVSVGSDGFVNIPLVVRMSNTSTPNLVTSDWLADMMVALLSVSPRNETYHLVHPKPPRVRVALDISLHYLNMGGVKVVETK